MREIEREIEDAVKLGVWGLIFVRITSDAVEKAKTKMNETLQLETRHFLIRQHQRQTAWAKAIGDISTASFLLPQDSLQHTVTFQTMLNRVSFS